MQYQSPYDIPDFVQSPVATKETPDQKAGGNGPADKGSAPAAASSSAAWNPFKSRPKSPPPSEFDQAAGASGGKEAATARPARPPPAVPTDHDILTSLPSDTIWNNMQQHASEGITLFLSIHRLGLFRSSGMLCFAGIPPFAFCIVVVN